MHTKSGSSIWRRSWMSIGSYCVTNWSHCKYKKTVAWQVVTLREKPRRGRRIQHQQQQQQLLYLLLHRVWQEAAHLPYSLLNLFFSGIFLQEFVNVGHGHLAHFAVGAGFEARLIESNWRGKKKKKKGEISAVGLPLRQVNTLKETRR